MEDRIHILRGRGDNCSCYDCCVLYGGECATTKTNDFLDTLEEQVNEYLNFTPTGKPRVNSSSYIDKCIDVVIRPAVCKFLKVKKKDFYEKYYVFTQLIFLMTSDKRGAESMYRRARGMLFDTLEREFTHATVTFSKKYPPVEGDTITVMDMVAEFKKK